MSAQSSGLCTPKTYFLIDCTGHHSVSQSRVSWYHIMKSSVKRSVYLVNLATNVTGDFRSRYALFFSAWINISVRCESESGAMLQTSRLRQLLQEGEHSSEDYRKQLNSAISDRERLQCHLDQMSAENSR